MHALGMKQSCLPHFLPLCDLLSWPWESSNLSPPSLGTTGMNPLRLYRVSSVQAPQNPKTALRRLQCEAVQTAICSTASQIFPPHIITEAAKKPKTKPMSKRAHLPLAEVQSLPFWIPFLIPSFQRKSKMYYLAEVFKKVARISNFNLVLNI